MDGVHHIIRVQIKWDDTIAVVLMVKPKRGKEGNKTTVFWHIRMKKRYEHRVK
jgi:hypothetical protein